MVVLSLWRTNSYLARADYPYGWPKCDNLLSSTAQDDLIRGIKEESANNETFFKIGPSKFSFLLRHNDLNVAKKKKKRKEILFSIENKIVNET